MWNFLKTAVLITCITVFCCSTAAQFQDADMDADITDEPFDFSGSSFNVPTNNIQPPKPQPPPPKPPKPPIPPPAQSKTNAPSSSTNTPSSSTNAPSSQIPSSTTNNPASDEDLKNQFINFWMSYYGNKHSSSNAPETADGIELGEMELTNKLHSAQYLESKFNEFYQGITENSNNIANLETNVYNATNVLSDRITVLESIEAVTNLNELTGTITLIGGKRVNIETNKTEKTLTINAEDDDSFIKYFNTELEPYHDIDFELGKNQYYDINTSSASQDKQTYVLKLPKCNSERLVRLNVYMRQSPENSIYYDIGTNNIPKYMYPETKPWMETGIGETIWKFEFELFPGHADWSIIKYIMKQAE